MQHNKIYLLLMMLASLASCTDDEVEVDADEKLPVRLTGSSYIASRSAQELKTYVNAASLDINTDRLRYDVDYYQIDYTTGYNGKEITASGIAIVPKTNEAVPLLSYQHGTIAANRQAPSQLSSFDYELILYQGMASAGFMVVVPDYIGFGSSAAIMHPYYVKELTASAIVDNIYSAKNLADELAVNLDQKLYLAGYSQGGYATVATHKYIEEQGIQGFDLQASFASSGGYDIKGMQDYFFKQEVYHQPFFMAYVAQAYSVTFDMQTDLSSYFNEPYASAIPGYFDGSLSGAQINDRLNDTLSVLVNTEYLNSTANDIRFKSINDALTENSLLDWTPSIELHLYHGDADITVPYQNSVDTYNHFLENGASQSVVTFTPLPGATHSSGYAPYLEMFINKLLKIEGL